MGHSFSAFPRSRAAAMPWAHARLVPHPQTELHKKCPIHRGNLPASAHILQNSTPKRLTRNPTTDSQVDETLLPMPRVAAQTVCCAYLYSGSDPDSPGNRAPRQSKSTPEHDGDSGSSVLFPLSSCRPMPPLSSCSAVPRIAKPSIPLQVARTTSTQPLFS